MGLPAEAYLQPCASCCSIVILLGYPRIGSVVRVRCRLCGADCRIFSHSVAAHVGGCTMIPHARGLGLGGGTNLPYGISQPTNSTVRLPRIRQG
jgi:hypothetical protein